jgi:hypothetical protein
MEAVSRQQLRPIETELHRAARQWEAAPEQGAAELRKAIRTTYEAITQWETEGLYCTRQVELLADAARTWEAMITQKSQARGY